MGYGSVSRVPHDGPGPTVSEQHHGARGVEGDAGPGVRAADDRLPVPSVSDVWIVRAQEQYERGHLHDALVALDRVRPGDPVGAEAERLKGVIQSKLLEAARAGASRVAPRGQDAPRK